MRSTDERTSPLRLRFSDASAALPLGACAGTAGTNGSPTHSEQGQFLFSFFSTAVNVVNKRFLSGSNVASPGFEFVFRREISAFNSAREKPENCLVIRTALRVPDLTSAHGHKCSTQQARASLSAWAEVPRRARPGGETPFSSSARFCVFPGGAFERALAGEYPLQTSSSKFRSI